MANFDFQQTAQDLQDFVNRTPAEIAELRALYEALTQTGVTPVAADDWPVSDPQQNVIYRVAGTSSYTDYMWDGTDFIPMATYTNTPTDIPIVGSTDVITAGGVANHGSAFDISEYNKNGSTLATYADLAAALGTDGANVPSDVRKGGMSVKFVQSNDNKYVQYFLTKDEWSSSKADWEKINLEEEVSQLGQEVTGNISKQISWTPGYINVLGTINNSSLSQFSQPFLLKAGEKVIVGTLNTNIAIICETDADSLAVGDTVTVIQKTSTTSQYEEYSYTATEDKKIVVCVLASNYNLSFLDTNGLIPFKENTKFLLYSSQSLTDEEKDEAKANIGIPLDINSALPKYFSNNTKDLNDRIKEIYFDGVDSAKQYEVFYCRYYNSYYSVIIRAYTEADKSDAEYAYITNNTQVSSNGIIKLMPQAGFSGNVYVVLTMTPSDISRAYGDINYGVATNLNYSPTIYSYLKEISNGAVTTEKIAYGAVTLVKTNFGIVGKNKYNKDTSYSGILVKGKVTTPYNAWLVSELIPINASSVYSISVNGAVLPAAIRIALYASDGTTVNSYNDRFNSQNISTGASDAYLRISFPVSMANYAKIQVEEGNEVTPYESFGLYINPDVIKKQEEFPEIVLPSTVYALKGYENSIYHKNIMEYQDPMYCMDGGVGIWKYFERYLRTQASSAGNLSIKYKKLVDLSTIRSLTIPTSIGDPTVNNGNKVVNVIGDSFTYGGIWVQFIKDNCQGLTFVGMRKPTNSYGIDVSSLRLEGRGGWRLSSYFEPYADLTPTHMQPFSPFMHVSGYTYYGPVEFWKTIVTGTSQYVYGTNGFDDYVSWFDNNGYKVNPSVNDLMYDGTNDKYVYWNSTAWVDFDGTPTFVFDYAKYISTWNIASPDFVLIMLGVNDWFAGYNDADAVTWNEQMGTFIQSVQAYADSVSKTIVIGVCTNTTVIGTPCNVYNKNPFINSRSEFLGRKNTIHTFDNDTYKNSNVFVVDTGACLDTDYGFDMQEIKPFDYYEGTVRELYDSNGVHPSPAGYKQLGTCAAGFIQYIRGINS